MSLSLTDAHKSDLALIFDIQKKAFESLYSKYHDDNTSPYMETFKSLHQKFVNPENHFFLIQLESLTVGFLKISTNSKRETIRISPIAILPKHENKGYGKLALFEAETKFEAKKSILSTIKQEDKLVHFYKSCGYTPTGYKESNTEGMSFIYFEKFLRKWDSSWLFWCIAN